MAQLITIQNQNQPCAFCPIASACFAEKSSNSGANNRSHKIYHKRERLYTESTPFSGIFVLRSGSAKSYIVTDDGDEQIIGFHFPGDVLGVDGFENEEHQFNVEFLETSSVCFMSQAEMHRTLADSKVMRNRLLGALSHVLVDEHKMRVNLGKFSAEQRIAQFLITLSERNKSRGLCGYEFILSMTRTDIANYLGLAIETVSRLFSRMQQQGVLALQHRQVKIENQDALNAMLGIQAVPVRKHA